MLRRFREVARSNFLWHAFMLLFFNKTDLFDEMLTMKPLSECFPRCSGWLYFVISVSSKRIKETSKCVKTDT